MPKEMLPIVDKPTIQYIVEEAIESGIEDIIIVTSNTKRAIEDHFDTNFELEENLRRSGKTELLKKVKESEVDIHYIRQKEPKGLGHAVWCARKFIGDDPFAVLLGDDIVVAETPGLKQLIAQYAAKNASIVGDQTVRDDATDRFGSVDPCEKEGRVYEVKEFVENPKLGAATSNLAIMGRYVLTPEIFKHLDKHEIGAGGEIQLTDAIQMLNEEQKVYAYDFEGKRYDVGEKLGFIQTTVEFALRDPEIGDEVKKGLKKLLAEEVHV